MKDAQPPLYLDLPAEIIYDCVKHVIYRSVPGLCSHLQPFYQPNECGKALCVRPDMMELDELYEFPEFSRDPTMYLALRNLILASWNRNYMVCIRVCHLYVKPGRFFVCFLALNHLIKNCVNIILHVMKMKIVFSQSSKGGVDSGEMCSAHHRPWFGASVLFAGNGPCASLHD